ncbi:hypothetical protein [Leptospira santarosai]|nr:hypothetical protein [Leptospira santarosai]MDI7165926.1 XRE family transcriptional regulator [Leptospira santarosai]MDI7219376.1 XRE family transcriptional regulator [Leptospira santarosai]MDO6383381.1 XRE family transcriptional regulator [Leptospira santarosai]
MAIKKETIDRAIERRQHCLDTSESDRLLLIDYIREFVDSKRGNQRLLTNASGVPESRISNLIRGTGRPPGIESIVALAKIIQNLHKE